MENDEVEWKKHEAHGAGWSVQGPGWSWAPEEGGAGRQIGCWMHVQDHDVLPAGKKDHVKSGEISNEDPITHLLFALMMIQ